MVFGDLIDHIITRKKEETDSSIDSYAKIKGGRTLFLVYILPY